MDSRWTLEELLCNDSSMYILPYIDAKSIGPLACTSRFFAGWDLNLKKISRAAHFIVVKASVIELEKILKALDNETLKQFLQTRVKNVIDKSNRTILDYTILQLAYGAGDNDMCFKLQPYFERAFGKENALQIICEQLDEKFSQSSELDVTNVLAKLLDTVITTISTEKFGQGQDKQGRWILHPDTLNSINAFREAFHALHPKTITQGMHCRYASIQQILEAYESATKKLSKWQCVLFEDSILMTGLETLPANDAMACTQGLKKLFTTKNFLRSFELKNKQSFYQYLRGESVEFSALTGARIDIYLGTILNNGNLSSACLAKNFSEHIQTKMKRLGDLKTPQNQLSNIQ